jgi:retron-type reverse transcriptase
VAIFEVDFSDVSYGFRPYRSCHDALDMVDMIIMTKPVNSVVDMDITKFFDMVDHECMMECLKQRVVDSSLLRITFDFIGFTLYCDITRNGKFKVGRKTSSKKFRQKMKTMNLWLKGVRNRMKSFSLF